MDILFAVGLMAVLLLPIELLRFPSSPLDRVAERISQWELISDGGQPGTAEDRRGEGVEVTLEWGLITRDFIRRRLQALTDELERLDRDPDTYAKAFHTMVARSAYQALLVDASKLSDEPCQHAVQTLDFELVGPATGLSEVLEL